MTVSCKIKIFCQNTRKIFLHQCWCLSLFHCSTWHVSVHIPFLTNFKPTEESGRMQWADEKRQRRTTVETGARGLIHLWDPRVSHRGGGLALVHCVQPKVIWQTAQLTAWVSTVYGDTNYTRAIALKAKVSAKELLIQSGSELSRPVALK